MTTEQLYNELNHVNHSLEKRLYYTYLTEKNPNLIPKLLTILFRVNDPISVKAAWIFEFLCSYNIDYIVSHLDVFTENINKVHIDSAVRPIAKVCESIAKAYTSKLDNNIKKNLTEIHKTRIIETCFDYMINDIKVAPKAYSMVTLFLLGKDYDWIHPELARILEDDFTKQSPAFKARARHILKKINKC